MKAVGVVFDPERIGTRDIPKVYYYKYLGDDIAIGDIVVVDVCGKYKCVNVVEVTGAAIAVKYVVCKVNITEFKEREDAAVKKADIRRKMDALRDELQKLHEYETYAKESTEFAELLLQYKNLL